MSGNSFANLCTSCFSFFIIALSVHARSASSMMVAIFVISFFHIPLVVRAAVQILSPLGSAGDLLSNGITFLFTEIPILSSISCALFPVRFVFSVHRNASVMSIMKRWLSVHSETIFRPRSNSSCARCCVFSITFLAYFLNAGCIAS